MVTYYLKYLEIFISLLVIDDQRAKQEKKMVLELGVVKRRLTLLYGVRVLPIRFVEFNRGLVGFPCFACFDDVCHVCWSLLGYVKWLMYERPVARFIRYLHMNSARFEWLVHFNNNELSLSKSRSLNTNCKILLFHKRSCKSQKSRRNFTRHCLLGLIF